MARFPFIVLIALLLLPLTTTPAAAKAPTSKSQVHVVRQGDTLSAIAQRHGLTVKELKRLNGLNSSRRKLGQKLALDRATAPPRTRESKKSAKEYVAGTQKTIGTVTDYVVKRGDSLYTIARRHNLTVDELKRLNGLTSTRLKPGQRLALPGTTQSTPVVAKRAQPASIDTHVVKKGETLASIARRHGMAVDDLKRINDLTSSRLKIGQRLALASRETEPSPLLLPGDASEDEVLEMAYTTSSELEQVAFNYLSTPYRFGGNSRKGIDCSAFVQQVFREVEVELPRSAREQFRVGDNIDREQLQKGDLLFFRTYAKYPSHVGIYLGDGKMIHASSRSRRVVVTSIDQPYYRQRFIGAKRISLLDSEPDDAIGNVPDQTLVDEPLIVEIDDLAAPVESAAAASAITPDLGKSAGPTNDYNAPSPAVAAGPSPN
jgi:LysM repeat protein